MYAILFRIAMITFSSNFPEKCQGICFACTVSHDAGGTCQRFLRQKKCVQQAGDRSEFSGFLSLIVSGIDNHHIAESTTITQAVATTMAQSAIIQVPVQGVRLSVRSER